MAEEAQYGYGTEQDVESLVADDLLALKEDLEDQIASITAGGDPEVITDLQDRLTAVESALADKLEVDDLTAYATDAELAAAVAAATANQATDAELASGLSGKQDASTAATDAELAAGLAGKLSAVAALVGVSPTQLFYKVTRNGDATDTSTWSNIIEVWYDPNGVTAPRLVAWFNEYGELRLIPGNSNTVPFRVYAKDLIADPDHTGMLIEVVDHREGTRTTIAGFDSDGNLIAQNFAAIKVGGSEPVEGDGYQLWADTSGV